MFSGGQWPFLSSYSSIDPLGRWCKSKGQELGGGGPYLTPVGRRPLWGGGYLEDPPPLNTILGTLRAFWTPTSKFQLEVRFLPKGDGTLGGKKAL